MRAKDVVGRRIVKVKQTPINRGRGYSTEVLWGLDHIVLDNGTRIYFTVAEMPGDYLVLGHTHTDRPAGARP